MIYLGADHGGFTVKEHILKYLESMDIEARDLGAFELNEKDDYNDFASEVARYTRLERDNLGIVFCRSGIGPCIVANKFKNIFAATCFNEATAQSARRDNAANVMCVPSDYLSLEEVKKMVLTFIKTPFSLEERHVKRVSKVIFQDTKVNN